MRFPSATRLVVGFRHKRDAERFLCDLKDRLSDFSFELHPDKTRLIEFDRFAMANRRAREKRRPETFDFLGFTHDCRTTRTGLFGLGRKPADKHVNRTLMRIKVELHRRMHHNNHEVARWLGRVVGRWLRYYAVPTSFRSQNRFVFCLKRLWLRALRRRSQKDRSIWNWSVFAAIFWPPLRILHPLPAADPSPVLTCAILVVAEVST